MQFNEKLKKLRIDKGITQAELAEKIFVSRSAIAKWENGLGLPSGESLNMLAEFFGVKKSELLSDPETASVIVNKNHALSKQKIWIITLVALSCVLIIVAALLIPLALKKPSSDDFVYVHKQELIFETEKDIVDLDAQNYSDDKISTDKYFAPTRIFTYNSRSTTIILPRVLYKSVVGNNVTYGGYVHDLNCTVSENCTVRYNMDQELYYILPTDAPYSQKTEYCVNLSLGNMRLSIKLRQEAIQVENIELSLNSDVPDKVDIDSLTEISAQLTPYDATYQAIHYSIEKVLKPDGTPYEEHTQYANLYISDKVYLRTTQKIDVGAKIYLSAIAEKDQVRSNVLEIEVKRVPIKEITLMTNNEESYANIGELFYFRPVALDDNATFNVKGEQFEVTLLTPELATIEYSRGLNVYFITVKNEYTNLGRSIEVLVETPEGFTKSFIWEVSKYSVAGTPVEKVVLKADTDVLIKGKTVAKLTFEIFPAEAYIGGIIALHCYGDEYDSSVYIDGWEVWARPSATSGTQVSFFVEIYDTTTYQYVISNVVTFTIQDSPNETDKTIYKLVDPQEKQSYVLTATMQAEEFKKGHGY